MLCLLRVLLSWALLCLVCPVPLPTPTAPRACPSPALFKETMRVLQDLSSQDSSEVVLQNNVMEAGGNAAAYLEGFIESLRKSKEGAGHKLLLIQQLQKMQTYEKTCCGWKAALKDHHWEAVQEYDFFTNLEYLLRFLGHNALPTETMVKEVQGPIPACQET